MSVEDKDKIDFILSENGTGDPLLVISDHLMWSMDDKQALNYRVDTLLDKINAYIYFVESGQFQNDRPEFNGKNIAIIIYFKYELDEYGSQVVSDIRLALKNYNIGLRVEMLWPN